MQCSLKTSKHGAISHSPQVVVCSQPIPGHMLWVGTYRQVVYSAHQRTKRSQVQVSVMFWVWNNDWEPTLWQAHYPQSPFWCMHIIPFNPTIHHRYHLDLWWISSICHCGVRIYHSMESQLHLKKCTNKGWLSVQINPLKLACVALYPLLICLKEKVSGGQPGTSHWSVRATLP